MEGENVKHIFWECKESAYLWKAINRWFQYMFKIECTITYELIILNNFVGQYDMFINTVILLAKQYIYTTRCLYEKERKVVKFNIFTQRLYNLYKDELYIAQKNQKLFKHEKKWAIYKNNML